MSGASLFAGLDGLMMLSRREGVDVRPTLLRVLTDLYVQKPQHTAEEERQFIELTTRLFDDVDDATRAVVRAKLSTYPGTPGSIARKLSLPLPSRRQPEAMPSVESAPPLAPSDDVQEFDIGEKFFASTTPARLAILQQLELAPLRSSMLPTSTRASRAVLALENAALLADADRFIAEVAASLFLPPPTAMRIVADRSGETLACAMKALGMPEDIFQRVLMFLYPARGTSVERVYRLARLYSVLGEDAARSMITAWRGSNFVAASRGKHQSALYDDERSHVRAAAPSERAAPRASEAIRRAGRLGIRS